MELSRATFDELRELIHRLCGLDLSEDKAYLVRYRLGPVAHSRGCQSFEDFALTLRGAGTPALFDAMVEAITTNETSFFRDGHPFDAIRQHLLPRLGEAVRSRKALTPRGAGPYARFWCAGASTGQEPYSLAMLVHDFVATNGALGLTASDFGILATDVSAKVLATAAAGTYAQRDLDRGLTAEQIRRYFDKGAGAQVVQERVRKLVEFRRVNLVQPFPGPGAVFDLILCRNVLIYFDDATRQRICRHFTDVLADAGTLILGAAENLYGVTDRFESLNVGGTLVYRKRASTSSQTVR